MLITVTTASNAAAQDFNKLTSDGVNRRIKDVADDPQDYSEVLLLSSTS